jgi:outer membrane biosynthesis protein TonB
MPITQIPFQDPVAPPEKSQPEQLDLDLYATRDWEAAYRELDARVPHLLVQLQDDLARSRRREAAWISVVAHLLLFIMLWQMNLIEKYVPWHHAVAVPLHPEKDNLTFLALPPDLQKAVPKPNTNIASDKNRIAMSRHPEPNPNRVVAPPPGAPGMSGPRAAQPAPPQPPVQAQNQSQAPQQAQPSTPRPQFDTNQQAKLQTPPTNNARSVFEKYSGGQTAGSSIQQATQDVAANRATGGGQGGNFGLGTGAKGRQYGALDILSDTQGVDFGPYLQRVLEEVRSNWYHLIPESVEMKKGKLALEFAIKPDGSVEGLLLTVSSGDDSLDSPAVNSIKMSNPFPPLPTEFHGPFLALRFRFYYNPDKSEME